MHRSNKVTFTFLHLIYPHSQVRMVAKLNISILVRILIQVFNLKLRVKKITNKVRIPRIQKNHLIIFHHKIYTRKTGLTIFNGRTPTPEQKQRTCIHGSQKTWSIGHKYLHGGTERLCWRLEEFQRTIGRGFQSDTSEYQWKEDSRQKQTQTKRIGRASKKNCYQDIPSNYKTKSDKGRPSCETLIQKKIPGWFEDRNFFEIENNEFIVKTRRKGWWRHSSSTDSHFQVFNLVKILGGQRSWI